VKERKPTTCSRCKEQGHNRRGCPYDYKIGRQLAGRGQLGSQNWGGTDHPIEVLDQWLENLKPYFGKRVILAGGGGNSVEIVKLDNARLITRRDGMLEDGMDSDWVKENVAKDSDWNNKMGLRAYLSESSMFQRMADGSGTFTPWIDSWQIFEAIPFEPR